MTLANKDSELSYNGFFQNRFTGKENSHIIDINERGKKGDWTL